MKLAELFLSESQMRIEVSDEKRYRAEMTALGRRGSRRYM